MRGAGAGREWGSGGRLRMIVIGAGPIGLMFMQVAALSGVRVIAVVKRDDQIETAKLFGAE